MARRDFERDRSAVAGFVPFIICSLIFHGILLLLKIDIAPFEEDNLVSIKYFDAGIGPVNAVPEKILPEKTKEDLEKGQIVDIARPEFEKKPAKSKFLSEYDSSVQKETRSDFDNSISVRDRKLRKKLSESVPAEKTDMKEDSVLSPDNSAAAAHHEMVKKGEIKGFEGSDGKYLKGSETEKKGLVSAQDEVDIEGSQFVGGHRISERFLPYLNGNDPLLTTPSNDFLKDIEKGDETALNTKRFIYAAYFNKIKRAISKHWTPAYVFMINDPGGHLYGKKTRYTKLIVHISSNGVLVSTQVETSSGIDFLDREAINAFRTASPFSPPPEVLLSEKNVLEISFGFVVTME